MLLCTVKYPHPHTPCGHSRNDHILIMNLQCGLDLEDSKTIFSEWHWSSWWWLQMNDTGAHDDAYEWMTLELMMLLTNEWHWSSWQCLQMTLELMMMLTNEWHWRSRCCLQMNDTGDQDAAYKWMTLELMTMLTNKWHWSSWQCLQINDTGAHDNAYK